MFNGHTPRSHEKVVVEITNDNITRPYVRGFISEMYRMNAVHAKAVGLTEDELTDYINYIVSERCAFINGDYRARSRNKTMWIPDFVQYVIAMLGRVEKRELGLTLIPVYVGETISQSEAQAISDKIALLQDYMSVSRNSFPLDEAGDPEVMTTVLMSNTVVAMTPLSHPVHQLVTSFLGMRLKEEAAHGLLYRVQYDDLEYLASVLASIGGKVNAKL